MKAEDLVFGKNYYFSSSKDSWGTFITRDNKGVYFKPVKNDGYMLNHEGLLGFPVNDTHDYLEKETDEPMVYIKGEITDYEFCKN